LLVTAAAELPVILWRIRPRFEGLCSSTYWHERIDSELEMAPDNHAAISLRYFSQELCLVMYVGDCARWVEGDTPFCSAFDGWRWLYVRSRGCAHEYDREIKEAWIYRNMSLEYHHESMNLKMLLIELMMWFDMFCAAQQHCGK
jgi:hypothetical protein